jgi:alkaline phosphatase
LKPFAQLSTLHRSYADATPAAAAASSRRRAMARESLLESAKRGVRRQ